MDIYDPIGEALGIAPMQIIFSYQNTICITEGVSGFEGKTHSKEWKIEASKRAKNRIWKDETKAKISAKKKGFIFTEEHRAKLSEAKKGKPSNNKRTKRGAFLPP